MKVRPKCSPGRRSTQAPKTRPVATETSLSHGSAWMPRVTPRRVLNDIFCCTGPKSGRPAATIVRRCQFSLNQPRLSPRTSRSTRNRPGMLVVLTCGPAIGYWPRTAYAASVPAFCGRHHASWSRYQAMVSARPLVKSAYAGRQPSSVRSLVASMA